VKAGTFDIVDVPSFLFGTDFSLRGINGGLLVER
jgi:hypothetical protein